MKEVIAEFPLMPSHEVPALALYRFPCSTKNLQPSEIKYKPLSGYTEIKVPFPQRNVSALKLKLLNSTHLVYKSHPAALSNHYSVHISDGKLYLRKIQSAYLFYPDHHYYEIAAQGSALKKAESREELEHRKRSINYKLRNIESEEARILQFRDGSSRCASILMPGDGQAVRARADESAAVLDLSKLDIKASRRKIEETVKHARVCNLRDLVAIFGDENAVKNVLFKMTERVAGRLVLQNSYYEKRLWDARSALLDLFRTRRGEILISETRFLGEESWMADEVADRVGLRYILRGFEEGCEFDIAALESSNRRAIDEALKQHRMLSLEGLCACISLDQEVLQRLVSNPGYLCLSNNAYVLDDVSYWFNPVLKAYASKKSLEMPEIKASLEAADGHRSEGEILAELKHYCSQRGGKYHLKIAR